MTRNTLKQIQILPIWFNKTAILTVQKVNIHKFIRSNLIKKPIPYEKNSIELYIWVLSICQNWPAGS